MYTACCYRGTGSQIRKHQSFFRWLTRWSLIAFRDVGLTLWAGKSIMSRTVLSGKESLVGKVSWKKQTWEKYLYKLYDKSSLLFIKCSKRFVMVQRPPWHHLQDSPPPPEIHDRVIQREDDTPETSLWYIMGSVLVSPAAAPRMIHQTSIDAVESVICGYHSFDKDIGSAFKEAPRFSWGYCFIRFCRWVGSPLYPWSLGFVAGWSHTTRTGREMDAFPKCAPNLIKSKDVCTGEIPAA